MRLLKVQIENFMGLVGDHELVLDQLGLVHIGGENKDDPGNASNGSGKTTILEAITWCLFGQGLPRPQGNSEKGVSADEVLNDRLKKQCCVSVALSEEDGTQYTVRRWRKWKGPTDSRQSSGQLFLRNGEPTQALDEKETNRLICEQLGVTYDVWCRGVVFGQESGFNFCEATAKSRQDILTTVMGLEEIDTWHNRCRDEKRALANEVAKADGRLTALREEASRLAAEDPTALIESWEADRARRSHAAAAELESIKAEGLALKGQIETLPPVPEPVSTVGQVDPSVLEPYQQAVRDKQAAEFEWKQSLSRQRAAEAELTAIKSATAPAVCPTCRQSISDEHRSSCTAVAVDQASTLKADTEQLKARLVQLAVVHDQHYAVYMEKVREKDAEAKQAAEANRQRDMILQRKSYLEQQIAVARSKWEQGHARSQAILQETNPHISHQAALQARQAENQRLVTEAETEQTRLTEGLDLAQWWDKELPRFRTWMFDSIVDVMAGEANRWLRIMSGGVIWIQISTSRQVGKRLKDELDVQIYRWNQDGSITNRSYRTWSGGEKRRVSLAVDLALSRLLAQRSGKTYKFLAMDEIDRHLDDQGRIGLRLVLDDLKSERDTCLVITHDPAFQASFDKQITVVRSEGQIKVLEEGRPRV